MQPARTTIRMGASRFEVHTKAPDGTTYDIDLNRMPARGGGHYFASYNDVSLMADWIASAHGITLREAPQGEPARRHPEKRTPRPRRKWHGRTYHDEPRTPPPLDEPQPHVAPRMM